jgi:hypothetical protein
LKCTIPSVRSGCQLCRAGPPAARPADADVSKWPDSPYYLLVCRKKQAPRRSVWPAFFTELLPPVPIPLAPPDADILLDIQPFVQAIYARSRYERDIDKPLDPPLGRTEAVWLDERLRK